MGFPTCRRSTSYARRPLHHLVDDDSLGRTILIDLDESLPVCRHDCRVEPCLLLVHPEKAKDRGHKLTFIFVNVELLRCDAPEPIKCPYPHEGPADGKAQDEATVILRNEHLPGVPPRSSHAIEALSADGLLFSFLGTKICDQRHRESFPALVSLTNPMSNLRSPVEPCIGLLGWAQRPSSTLMRWV